VGRDTLGEQVNERREEPESRCHPRLHLLLDALKKQGAGAVGAVERPPVALLLDFPDDQKNNGVKELAHIGMNDTPSL
jgi:hypothetical protein